MSDVTLIRAAAAVAKAMTDFVECEGSLDEKINELENVIDLDDALEFKHLLTEIV